MKEMIVKWEPEYLPYVYDVKELDEVIRSILKETHRYRSRDQAYGCICDGNITLIQKDKRLFARLNHRTMYMDKDYECPEKEKTPASDIFSLGILWHILLSEEVPFWLGDHEHLCDAVLAGERIVIDPQLDDLHYNLISRMLEKEPGNRPSADEILESLAVGHTEKKYRRAHDGTGCAKVHVADAAGKPIGNAIVSVYNVKNDENSEYGNTDEEGNTEILFPSGRCWISIFASGYEMYDQRFFIYAEEEKRFNITMHAETEVVYPDEMMFDEDEIPF